MQHATVTTRVRPDRFPPRWIPDRIVRAVHAIDAIIAHNVDPLLTGYYDDAPIPRFLHCHWDAAAIAAMASHRRRPWRNSHRY